MSAPMEVLGDVVSTLVNNIATPAKASTAPSPVVEVGSRARSSGDRTPTNANNYNAQTNAEVEGASVWWDERTGSQGQQPFWQRRVAGIGGG